MDPGFNLRECAKQIILLEAHLNNPRLRCSDCQKKHALTIEALAEEAKGLDKDGLYGDLTTDLADSIRTYEKKYLQGYPQDKLAQMLRKIRKQLMNRCFDKF
jgi:hypothetical protein